MSFYLLDASAVLALLGNEQGSERIEQILAASESSISSVNLAEVAAKLCLLKMPLDKVNQVCAALPMSIIPVTERHCWASVAYAAIGKRLGLSLGDRICLGVATVEDAVAVTADRSWKQVRNGPRIECIR